MKALLVISFGTTFNDTREKTIDSIEEDLSIAFPDRKFYRAWTSGFIRKKLLSRDGTKIDGLDEAFDRMKADGVTDVLIQPTHMIPGNEFNKIIDTADAHRGDFQVFKMGLPMLSSAYDLEEAAENLMSHFRGLRQDEGLILMGHGTPTGDNSVYTDLENTFDELGYDRVFVGTVEAEPGLDDMVRKAQEAGLKRVILTPLLIVAGDHATNDMAGDEPDSWKSVFIEKGFQVSCVIKGLGEYKDMRSILVRHAMEALK